MSVPQRSVLGPVLFVIFINDLPEALDSACKLFADDSKIYRSVKLESGRVKLQKDVNLTNNWSKKWQLPFNGTKSHALHLGQTNQRHQYELDGHILEVTEEEKDLGVIVDD